MTKEKYALLDTDFISKTHLIRKDDQNKMIDRVMELPEYRFYCHEQIRTELTRHDIGDSPEWLETKISDGSVHCISDEKIIDAVLLWYEKPADQSETVQAKRAGYGQGYYDKYAGKPADGGESSGEVIRWYRVRKSWADSKTQKGAYKILENAKECAGQNQGYKVFDADGKVVYDPKKAAETTVKVPFMVRVSVPDLNIRTGPGVDHPRTGMFTGIGTFTIVEVKKGKGSSEGWGRLKSGAGWIALSLVKRV